MLIHEQRHYYFRVGFDIIMREIDVNVLICCGLFFVCTRKPSLAAISHRKQLIFLSYGSSRQ